MKEFKSFYIFGLNAKFYMGIYFAAIVFAVGLVTFLSGGEALSLTALLQMFLLSLGLGFLQEGLLGAGADYSQGVFFGRSLFFLTLATAAATLFSWGFHWFGGGADWCVPLFGLFMLAGFVAMLVGEKFEQERDTLRLNSQLKEYQEKL